MDPVVAAAPLGQQLDDRTGDPADPRLQGGPVGDEACDVIGDGAVHAADGAVGNLDWLRFGLDEHADLVAGECMRVPRRDPEGARQVGTRLDDQQSVGVSAAALHFLDGGVGVKRQADTTVCARGEAAVAITRGSRRRAMRAKRRKSPGTNSMWWTFAASARSTGP